ncbi:mCG147922 [Mus musculus]|nr:mCG147922 [Mus musculus]
MAEVLVCLAPSSRLHFVPVLRGTQRGYQQMTD